MYNYGQFHTSTEGERERGRRQGENGKKIENKYTFIHNTQMYKVQDKIPGLVGVGST